MMMLSQSLRRALVRRMSNPFSLCLLVASALILTVGEIAWAQTPAPATGPATGPQTPKTPKTPQTPTTPVQDAKPFGDEVVVVLTAPEEDLAIGQEVEVIVEIQHAEAIVFERFEPSRAPYGHVLISASTQETTVDDAGQALTRIVLIASIRRVGRFYLTPLRITAVGEPRYAETPMVSFFVAPSLLADLDTATVQLAGAPVTILEADHRPWTYGGAILGTLFLLVTGFIMIRRSRRRRAALEEAMRPPEPPWDVALRRLKALEADDLPAPGPKRREAYFELSEIIREYLGQRFRFDGLEMTTSEVLDRMKRYDLPRRLRMQEIENFLLDADLVKFARYRASDGELRAQFAGAYAIIEKTKPGLGPRPETPEAERADTDRAAKLSDADLDRLHPHARWMPPEIRADLAREADALDEEDPEGMLLVASERYRKPEDEALADGGENIDQVADAVSFDDAEPVEDSDVDTVVSEVVGSAPNADKPAPETIIDLVEHEGESEVVSDESGVTGIDDGLSEDADD